MARRQSGDKPLSEPMMDDLCIGSDYGLVPTRQKAIIWTNDGNIDAYMCHLASMS